PSADDDEDDGHTTMLSDLDSDSLPDDGRTTAISNLRPSADDDDEDDGHTTMLSDLDSDSLPDDGRTMAISNLRPSADDDDDGRTTMLSDLDSDSLPDDGRTTAISNLRPSADDEDDGHTTMLSDLDSDSLPDDGRTMAISNLRPSADDDEDDGHTTMLSDLDSDSLPDDGRTTAISNLRPSADDDEDDGHTTMLSDLDSDSLPDDGRTMAISNLRPSADDDDEDDGHTTMLSDLDPDSLLDDGRTTAISNFHPSADDKSVNDTIEEEIGHTFVLPQADLLDDNDDDGYTVDLSDLGTQPDIRSKETTVPLAEELTQTKVGQSPQQATTVRDTQPTSKTVPKKLAMSQEGTIQEGEVLENRYKLNKILGKGGFGAAYLAEDIRLHRECVVKQMLVPRGRSAKQIKVLQDNFEQEANLLAQLNQPGHPHIPEIYDYFSDETGSYLVMKYIEGKDLGDVIKQSDGLLPWRETVRYVIDMCDALDYMHTKGKTAVMHRDIKPGNVLLGNDGRLWLVDFGLASAGGAENESSGSPGYTPLEQWFGKAEPTSDVYATGATLHYMLSGISPLKAFGGKITIPKIKQLYGQVTPLADIDGLDENLPKELDTVIKGAIAVETSDRPSANQLKQQLELLLSGMQSSALYTFNSGEPALTINQLVDLCDAYPEEAQGYLYKGDFERWFVLIERPDMAEAAQKAVEQYPDDRVSGLQRFLKNIKPGLIVYRLAKAMKNIRRWAGVTILTVTILLCAAFAIASYGSRFLLRSGIASYPWSFLTLKMDEPNVFDEEYLTENLKIIVEPNNVENARVDLVSPNRINFEGKISNYEFDFPMILKLEDKQPHLYFAETSDWAQFLLLDNLSTGINEGISDSFGSAPIDIKELTVNDEAIVFNIEESNRAPWLTATPGPTATSTPLPAPTVTPTPEGPALIVVYNDLSQAIILNIEGETWNIAANDTEVVEKLPGIYDFTIVYQDNGQLAINGIKTWDVKAYRWHINTDELN
ncbi:serine/threonine-protein kinase, partial [Anaerolineales bacterium HSG25]|nr:serine/threonine-protein kinase [Anaerolineales bacterium HSG25]